MNSSKPKRNINKPFGRPRNNVKSMPLLPKTLRSSKHRPNSNENATATCKKNSDAPRSLAKLDAD